MSSLSRGPKSKSRDLLIQAAIDVFSREGIKGATTREIATVAGVNESTLFRNFESKEALLQAAVAQGIIDFQSALCSRDWTFDLQEDLTHFVTLYNRMLEERESFIRVFIAEARQQPEEGRQVIHSAGQPLRDKLLGYFEAMQEQGKIRKGLPLVESIDIFTGMILAGVLKRNVTEKYYSREDYLKTCVNLFIHGIQSVPVA